MRIHALHPTTDPATRVTTPPKESISSHILSLRECDLHDICVIGSDTAPPSPFESFGLFGLAPHRPWARQPSQSPQAELARQQWACWVAEHHTTPANADEYVFTCTQFA